jgi:hypothetical protein
VKATNPRLIFEWRLTFAIKHLDEDVVDQVVHRLAAAAVGQRDVWHLHFAAVPGFAVLCCYLYNGTHAISSTNALVS